MMLIWSLFWLYNKLLKHHQTKTVLFWKIIVFRAVFLHNFNAYFSKFSLYLKATYYEGNFAT